MEVFWYGVLGAILFAYFALGGLDYGVGLLLPAMLTERDRRRALNAVGPRFLGNEVWIVAAAGVLIAAFPRLEGELFGAVYPVFVAVLLALVAVNAAWQLRSRGRVRRGLELAGSLVASRPRAAPFVDAVILAASAVLALGWGVLLGGLLTGRPVGADGHVASYAGLLGWYPLLVGLATAGLFTVHGAVYLAWRLDAPRARAIASGMFAPVAALAALAGLLGYLSPAVRAAVANPAVATSLVLLIPVALAGSALALRAGRGGLATLATGCAAGLPVLATGAALYPGVLVSTVDDAATVTVAGGAAGPDALALLAAIAGPLLPILIAAQVACWWLYRQRDDRRVPVYW
jgi:cytochrome d ubiquinol oxidase subunit II